MGIKFDLSTIQYVKLFENITRAKVKDCLEAQEKIVFVVPKGSLGKAIGRGSKNLKSIKFLLKKNIDIIEYSEDLAQFVKNIFHRYKVNDVKFEENQVEVKVDPLDKAKAIGKNGRNLKLARELANRHYGIKSMVIR